MTRNAGEEWVAYLNRRAGTTAREAAGAANTIAGTTGMELVGALNTKLGRARTDWLELQGALDAYAAVPTTTYADVVLADAPVGYWKLDQTSGTQATDSSGNNRHGTYTGSYVLNQALNSNLTGVDLTGGYVTIANNSAFSGISPSPLFGQLTVEAWVKPDTFSPSNMFVTKGNNADRYEWDMRGGNPGSALMAITMTNTGTEVLSATSASVLDTTVQHIAFTYRRDTGLLIVYRNGVEIVRDNTVNGSNVMGNTDSPVQIGRRGDAAGALYDGKVAHVAIYQTALSAARILAHYNAGIA